MSFKNSSINLNVNSLCFIIKSHVTHVIKTKLTIEEEENEEEIDKGNKDSN
jgi:hypothetical protein